MNSPKTMKALVVHASGDYRFEPAWPVPDIGPGDILVKTEGCGVCASDVKCAHGAVMFWGGEGQPSCVKPPFIPGHEFVGTVAAVGEHVKDFEPGDRVTAEQIVPCGECRFCRQGQYWMCQPHAIFGFQTEYSGGMAEYIRLPARALVHKVPRDLPLGAALLIEPYGCSKHAVDRAQIGCEDTVVIAGAGTLGLGMVTYARLKNPARLIALDMADNRLAKAREFGADLALDPGRENVVQKVLDLTGGYGCDIYIEATGHPASVAQGLAMIRKLGRFVEFSVFSAPASVDWSIIGDRKELDLLGSHLSPYCYPFVIEHIHSGKLKTGGVVTRTFPIEQWAEAFEYASGRFGDIKVALTF